MRKLLWVAVMIGLGAPGCRRGAAPVQAAQEPASSGTRLSFGWQPGMQFAVHERVRTARQLDGRDFAPRNDELAYELHVGNEADGVQVEQRELRLNGWPVDVARTPRLRIGLDGQLKGVQSAVAWGADGATTAEATRAFYRWRTRVGVWSGLSLVPGGLQHAMPAAGEPAALSMIERRSCPNATAVPGPCVRLRLMQTWRNPESGAIEAPSIASMIPRGARLYRVDAQTTVELLSEERTLVPHEERRTDRLAIEYVRTDGSFGQAQWSQEREARFALGTVERTTDAAPQADPVAPTLQEPDARVMEGELTNDDRHLPLDGAPYDALEVEARAGEVIRAELESTAFVPRLRLVTDDGSLVGQAEGEHAARLSVAVPGAGHYRLIASATRPDARGAYVLMVRGGTQ